MKRVISVICLSALLICLAANVKTKAATLPAAYDILAQQPGIDITSLYYAYEQLSYEQQTIVHYIIGAYNNMYLTARGFSYDITYSQSAVMAEFLTLGQRVIDFAFTSIGWRSRINEVFRQYISGAIVYASQVNTSFMTWYESLLDGTIPELFIPYTKDAFDAWTAFYNDPSGDGIASFGAVVSEWQSGTLYDFDFVGYAWNPGNYETTYNNFILNNNPVIYSSTGSFPSQLVMSPKLSNNKIVDTLYIHKISDNNYEYRYGFSDFTYLTNSITINVLQLFVPGNKLATLDITPILRYGVYNFYSDLYSTINYAFRDTPFNITNYLNGQLQEYYNYYPFITHVYQVDDINTLSNPEELQNITDLNIVKPTNTREPYIIAPNDRLLFTTRPVGYDDPLGFWDIIKDNSYDPETGEQATDDDFRQDIVNNTVINNYYVTDNDRINVPVDWFDNDLSDQLANDSIPFLTFARDCIDTLGDLQIYLYGALVFGLGGGILKKFLL